MLLLPCYVFGRVGAVVPGQPLWGITKRISETVDIIESKVCLLDTSGLDGISSQLDVIESKIDALSACDPTPISSDDVVGGTITIDMSGNYCLTENVTADIIITGTCVSLDLNNRCVTGIVSLCTNDTELMNGNLTPPAPATTPNAAVTVTSGSDRAHIHDVNIHNTDTAAEDTAGRSGIEVRGNETHIINCTVVAGAGGESGAPVAANGGEGGSGLVITAGANNTLVHNCFFTGANGGAATNSGGDGGDGGRGILIASTAQGAEINECTVLATGNGGVGGAVSGVGGDGGDGIKIESTCIDISVRNCTIRNTGTGSVMGGGGAGVNGKAIDDDVTTIANLSMIYSNFAHNIANSIKYDLQATGIEQGVAMPNPPTSTVINTFANVFAS